MNTTRTLAPAAAALLLLHVGLAAGLRAADPPSVTLPAEVIDDKIRGGLLGHLLGDLNGLVHEMKYIDQPGDVRTYRPALPQGAWTDDDTDFEWVYLVAMERSGKLFLSPSEIPALWQRHINRKLWCADQYARQLMDLGIEPPRTGQIPFNPWSDFNLSGQFVCESFGLIAPAMPQTAARLGLNYTRVAIEGEPAQATQLFTAMIATAFTTADLDAIVNSGAAAVDPHSVIRRVADDVRAWHRQHPADWRATRKLVHDKYSQAGGAMRDRNGYELNSASAIAALLYGRGDFVETVRTAFNFGWDADNNAATAGTVVGVLKGRAWMDRQGWDLKDLYRNTSRDELPAQETITRFGDRLVTLAERVILERGGQKVEALGKPAFRIRIEVPANVEPLVDFAKQRAQMQKEGKSEITRAILHGQTRQQLARAAYEAIALDLAEAIRNRYPRQWAGALAALEGYPKVVQAIYFESPIPAGEALRARAAAAGLSKPAKRIPLW